MKFVLEIQCDNDAFAENPNNEVVRLLHEVANRLEKDGHSCGGLVDYNGNSVGRFEYE
jgi:hypothetical protein